MLFNQKHPCRIFQLDFIANEWKEKEQLLNLLLSLRIDQFLERKVTESDLQRATGDWQMWRAVRLYNPMTSAALHIIFFVPFIFYQSEGKLSTETLPPSDESLAFVTCLSQSKLSQVLIQKESDDVFFLGGGGDLKRKKAYTYHPSRAFKYSRLVAIKQQQKIITCRG